MSVKDIDNNDYTQPVRELIPEFVGDFVRCIAVIDLGTQSSEWKGVKKSAPEVAYGFEILSVDSEGKPIKSSKGKTFVHWTTFKRMMSDKANLRKFLAAWRGRDYSADELKSFSVTKASGQYGLGSLSHNKSEKNDKIYENLQLSPIPKAVDQKSIPKGEVEPFWFKFADPNVEALKKIPNWMQKKIKAAPEYKEVFGDKDPLSENDNDDDLMGLGSDGSEPSF